MAIKSKSRAKGKGRQVAKAPRPTPVEVKPPFFLRKRVQIVLALLAGILVTLAAVWVREGLRAESETELERRRQRATTEVVSSFQIDVDAALASVGVTVGSLDVQPLPQLQDAIERLSKGKIDAKEAAAAGADVARLAASSAKSIEEIELADLVRDRGLDPAVLLRMFAAQDRLAQALSLYEQAGTMLGDAAGLDGRARGRYLRSAGAIADSALALFRDGYLDYSEALRAAELFQPVIPQLPGIDQPGG